jgi:hypothetical protein
MASAGESYPASEPRALALKGVAQPADIVEVGWR